MLKSKWFTPPKTHISPIKQQWLQVKFFFVEMMSLHFYFLTRYFVKSTKQALVF
jgi:hypothetical protein